MNWGFGGPATISSRVGGLWHDDIRWHRRESGLCHFTRRDHLFCPLLVGLRPVGFWPAGRKARGVAFGIHGLFEAVDPAKADGFLDCLYIIDRRLSGRLFVLHHPDFLFGPVILDEPFAQFRAGGDVEGLADFHGFNSPEMNEDEQRFGVNVQNICVYPCSSLVK